jgi:hypothetical protein
VIFKAATDATGQIRYVVGVDAESLLATRAGLDDAAYLEAVRQHFNLPGRPKV